jgi:SRSO17 transposase
VAVTVYGVIKRNDIPIIKLSIKAKIKIKYKEVGNLYGIRNWVEYGLKQSKNELGWADFE